MQDRSISDAQLRALLVEAIAAGDDDQAVLCRIALGEYGARYVVAAHDFTAVSPGFRRHNGCSVAEVRAVCAAALAEGEA